MKVVFKGVVEEGVTSETILYFQPLPPLSLLFYYISAVYGENGVPLMGVLIEMAGVRVTWWVRGSVQTVTFSGIVCLW